MILHFFHLYIFISWIFFLLLLLLLLLFFFFLFFVFFFSVACSSCIWVWEILVGSIEAMTGNIVNMKIARHFNWKNSGNTSCWKDAVSSHDSVCGVWMLFVSAICSISVPNVNRPFGGTWCSWWSCLWLWCACGRAYTGGDHLIPNFQKRIPWAGANSHSVFSDTETTYSIIVSS